MDNQDSKLKAFTTIKNVVQSRKTSHETTTINDSDAILTSTPDKSKSDGQVEARSVGSKKTSPSTTYAYDMVSKIIDEEEEEEDNFFEDSMADLKKAGGQKNDVHGQKSEDKKLDKCIEEDPFDDSFDFDVSSSNVNVIQPQHSSIIEPPSKKNDNVTVRKPMTNSYNRHVVTQVNTEKVYEIVLELKQDKWSSQGSRSYSKCVLKGSWVNTRVAPGDVINILLPSNYDDVTVVDDVITVDDKSEVLIVVNPDVLVSGTSIMSSMFCMRKAVLSEYFKSFDGGSRVMFVGTLVHELLQNCLVSQCKCKEEITEQVELLLKTSDMKTGMLSLGISEEEIRRELEPFLPHILFFIEKYVMDKNVMTPSAAYGGGGGGASRYSKANSEPPLWPGKILSVEDVEENIWSPRLGVKGKVDLTIRVELKGHDGPSKVIPLELKTGRPSGSSEHRGQVILYTMMMSEGERRNVESGLLLYLRNSALMEIKAGIPEQRGLVQLRNELVSNLGKSNDLSDIEVMPTLPEPINMKRACQQCELLPVCATYHKLSPEPEKEKAPAVFRNDIAPDAIAHLTEEHLEFYQKHSTNLLLETGEVRKASRLKMLWKELPGTRELKRSAIADLKMQMNSLDVEPLKHRFVKIDSATPISTSILHPGDSVIVSTDTNLAIAQGQVHSVTKDEIAVILDKTISVSTDSNNVKYHLDKYEYNMASLFSSQSSNFVNLGKLMLNNDQASKLRDLVIEKKAATFLNTLNKEFAVIAKHILRPLNTVQQKAVFKTLMANEYVLLEGMPGTGKTTVIVAFIRLLMVLGKSVLLTAYTHSAVDNVLLKLRSTAKQGEKSLDFLRIGKQSRIHPSLADSTFQAKVLNGSSGKVNLESLQNYPLVATTCLGVNHPAIVQRKDMFDYCIIDEAGQSLMASALGPLFHAKKFVLVGDPNQLPPVVTSTAAKSRGLDVSLFSHLVVKNQNVIPLTMQYRMNSEIQALANHMTYDNQLECGNESVANQKIRLPLEKANPESELMSADWAKVFIDEARSVIFFDTEGRSDMAEASVDNGVVNRGEAALVSAICRLVKTAFSSASRGEVGTPPSIGVMSPYRAQVTLLNKALSSFNVDVKTVDQFQGSDRDIVIYSCTKTAERNLKEGGGKESGNKDSILDDERRLNVAVTRAKAKLVIIGNSATLKSYTPFGKMLTYLDENNMSYKMTSSDDFGICNALDTSIGQK